VTRQPTSSVFPTVRFVPIDSVRVITIARPRDLLVLLIRCLTAILVGAALARPVLTPRRRSVARIVMVDVSSAVRTIADVRDSVRALLGPGDVLVPFDSGAHAIRRGALDSTSHLVRTSRDGRLSPALIAALRAASTVRDEADSIDLVIVSPLLAGEIDGATLGLRALWPGRMHLVRVAGDSDSTSPAGLAIEGAKDDPLVVAALAAGIARNDSAVRVLRASAAANDSVWATLGRRTLVRWPTNDAPPGWIAKRVADTVGGVVAGEAAVIFAFERRWTPDSATHPTRVVARWVDGQPAAIERRVGAGCIRDVAIPVPVVGDLMLRPAFGHFLRAIIAPCHAEAHESRLGDTQVSALAGAGRLAASRTIPAPDLVATPLVPWLLGAALLVALLEIFIR
jgi:hypothetical protein